MGSLQQPSDEREKVRRIFEYLRALNEQRNPPPGDVRTQPWCFWLREAPSHPAVFAVKAKSKGEEESADTSGLILRVRRPESAPRTRASDPSAFDTVRLFERLYELYERMEREGGRFELVLGDGLLGRTRAAGAVFHPAM